MVRISIGIAINHWLNRYSFVYSETKFPKLLTQIISLYVALTKYGDTSSLLTHLTIDWCLLIKNILFYLQV